MATNTNTSPEVAKHATEETRNSLTGLVLLGTFGAAEAPRALVRKGNGKTETVTKGDRLDGRTVVAIEEGRLALASGDRAEWLTQP